LAGGAGVSRLSAMLALQNLDAEIAVRRSDVNAIEASLSRDGELERLRQQARKAAGARRSAEIAAGKAEAAVADIRHRVERVNRRLYDGSVGNPQDLLGMQGELAGLREKLEVAEEDLLSQMEETEIVETEAATARRALGERQAEREAAIPAHRQRLEAVRGRLDELVRARDEAAASLDGIDLRTYERIAARRQPAVAHLDGDSCGGCHLPIGISEARQVKAGELVQCSNCDRILVM